MSAREARALQSELQGSEGEIFFDSIMGKSKKRSRDEPSGSGVKSKKSKKQREEEREDFLQPSKKGKSIPRKDKKRLKERNRKEEELGKLKLALRESKHQHHQYLHGTAYISESSGEEIADVHLSDEEYIPESESDDQSSVPIDEIPAAAMVSASSSANELPQSTVPLRTSVRQKKKKKKKKKAYEPGMDNDPDPPSANQVNGTPDIYGWTKTLTTIDVQAFQGPTPLGPTFIATSTTTPVECKAVSGDNEVHKQKPWSSFEEPYLRGRNQGMVWYQTSHGTS